MVICVFPTQYGRVSGHCCVQPHVCLSLSSLISLILGRLGMSVDKAIRCYGNLTGDVFSHKQTGQDGKFEVSMLEKVIKDIVKAETGQEDERMLGTAPDGEGCRT